LDGTSESSFENLGFWMQEYFWKVGEMSKLVSLLFFSRVGVDNDNIDVVNECSPSKDFICEIDRRLSGYLFRFGLCLPLR